MSLTFAREELTAELWAEATPLFHAHWREVAHFLDIPLEPDFEVYAVSEAAGVLRCFTARDGRTAHAGPLVKGKPRYVSTGDLVGYALFFVRSHPHYASSLQAAQDVLFLDPSHRGVSAVRFIRYCDEQLAAEGVEVVSQHLKAKHDHARLMDACGYELMDQIYVKRLNVPAAVA